jgi:hypothetical protein
MSNIKKYTLDDGSIVTSVDVSNMTGLSLKNSRVRLATSSDPVRVFRHKQQNIDEKNASYRIRSILNREASMYNEMYVLAFKTI